MDFYLIDGHSLIYRAFYAIRGLTDSSGRPTNAIFGFINALFKLIRERKPDALAVSFDSPQPTERHVLFERYKAHRPEMPDELKTQLPHIKRVLNAFRIKSLQMPGYEADDILATAALKASEAGMNVYIVTSDKDMLQVVDDSVKVYDPVKDVVIDRRYVEEKFGFPPSGVAQYMALVGDPVDNIPGVKGIGEKTAKALLKEFGGLDNLIARRADIKNPRIRNLIGDNIEAIKLSRSLAEANRSAAIDFDPGGFALQEPDWKALEGFLEEFEFTSLYKLLPEGDHYECRCTPASGIDELKEKLGSIKDGFSLFAGAGESALPGGGVGGFSVCTEKGEAFYAAFNAVDKKAALNELRPFLADEKISKTGHDLKSTVVALANEGVEIKGTLYDAMLAAYLLNPSRAAYGLEDLSAEYLSARWKPSIEDAAAFACGEAALTHELKNVLFGKLRDAGLERLYFDMEMPLIYVLADMERTGIKIDPGKLLKLSAELAGELDAVEKRIYFLAGEEFNINSPKQLGKILFEGLGLKPGRKKKTGFSTDVSTLEELAAVHELPREVLDWRSLSKLKNTYVDVLPGLINRATGRLHTSFIQTGTATGRLSSREPNLQNIPVKGDRGRLVREAFVADKGNVIIAADYSQIELRIMAHLSGDRKLTEAFKKGVDVHSTTASEIFGLPETDVTTDMRRVAKTVNFGIIYGITPFGLSEALGISKEEAAAYIERYFGRHPGVKEYIEKAVSEAREKGRVLTLFGRIRAVPEAASKEPGRRQFGERLAVNSPIQGAAADIIKIAMINVWGRLRKESSGGDKNFPALVLQVHDELIVEAPENSALETARMVKEEMEKAATLSVPLSVDVVCGRNWGALEPLRTDSI